MTAGRIKAEFFSGCIAPITPNVKLVSVEVKPDTLS